MLQLSSEGFYHCRLSSPTTLEYVSDHICQLLGYSRSEIHDLFTCHYSMFIHKEDRGIFNEKFHILSTREDTITSSFRIVTRDGRILHIKETMRSVLDPNGIMHGYTCIQNVTDQRLLTETLHAVTERYEQLQARLDNTYQRYTVSNSLLGTIVFEYDIANRKYLPLSAPEDATNTSQLFNLSETALVECLNASLENDPQHLRSACGQFFHADDVPVLEQALSQLTTNHEFRLELRAKQSETSYLWCSVMGKLVCDQNGTPARIMGTINNIDQSYRKKQQLLQDSQLEPLTGLLNKTSAIQKIKTVLESRDEHNHALMILDLDDFKSINDEMGHAFGDEVIVTVAKHLQSMFRSTDIVARFGGDEFMIFLPDVASQESVIEQAELLRQVFERTEISKHSNYKVSCSIGISISCGEKNFSTLFQQADTVLYQSKRDGKNRTNLFVLSDK